MSNGSPYHDCVSATSHCGNDIFDKHFLSRKTGHAWYALILAELDYCLIRPDDFIPIAHTIFECPGLTSRHLVCSQKGITAWDTSFIGSPPCDIIDLSLSYPTNFVCNSLVWLDTMVLDV